MYNICYYFLLFIIYAVIGWICEVILSLFEHKRFINRGFLIGPYCPIYGVGVLLIISLLKNYTDSWLVLFVLAMVLCMVLEYVTSYLMEKIFNARWWDYSDNKFNINGRICLETAIPFGIGGLIIMYIVNPFVVNTIDKFSDNTLLILGIVSMICFFVDLSISFGIIYKVRNLNVDIIKDNTEEMTKKVREYLSNHSVFTKRLFDSFPNVKVILKDFKKKIYKYSK